MPMNTSVLRSRAKASHVVMLKFVDTKSTSYRCLYEPRASRVGLFQGSATILYESLTVSAGAFPIAGGSRRSAFDPAPDEVLHLPFIDERAAEACWPTRQRNAGPAAFASPSSACTARKTCAQSGGGLRCRQATLTSDVCTAERGDALGTPSRSELVCSVSSVMGAIFQLLLWLRICIICSNCSVWQRERSLGQSGCLQACDGKLHFVGLGWLPTNTVLVPDEGQVEGTSALARGDCRYHMGSTWKKAATRGQPHVLTADRCRRHPLRIRPQLGPGGLSPVHSSCRRSARSNFT